MILGLPRLYSRVWSPAPADAAVVSAAPKGAGSEAYCRDVRAASNKSVQRSAAVESVNPYDCYVPRPLTSGVRPTREAAVNSKVAASPSEPLRDGTSRPVAERDSGRLTPETVWQLTKAWRLLL